MTKDEAQRRRWTFYEAVNIMMKLGCKNTAELVHQALRGNLIET